MRRTIFGFVFVTLLMSALFAPRLVAADDQQDTTVVSIVEPAGGTPQDWTYVPGELSVAVGTPVTWTNTGAAPHTVTSDDGVSFDSGNLDSQASFSFMPDSPGTFSYHCAYHPWMTGSLTVTS